MKKFRKITAFITALMLSTSAAVLPANAKVTDEELKTYIENIKPVGEYTEFNDYGYFDDILKKQDTKNLAHKDSYQGRYIPLCYELKGWGGEYRLQFLFPDAKQTAMIMFRTNDAELNKEITEKAAEVLGGDTEYKYVSQNAYFYADFISDEKIAEANELLAEYIDDGTMHELSVYSRLGTVYMSNYHLDRLYYCNSGYYGEPEYDFEAAAKYLDENKVECRIVTAVNNAGNQVYAVEFPEGTSVDEKFRAASLLKNEFGYHIALGQPYNFSDYKEVHEISADYTSPVTETQPQDESDTIDDDKILYGDLNYDRKTDVTDMSVLALHLIGDVEIQGKILMKAADIQYDNAVNLGDLACYKQYLSKQRDGIGKYGNLKDITDDTATIEVNGEYYSRDNDFFMVSSMDEYEKYIGSGTYEDGVIAEKGIEISDEFFENNRLAVCIDNSLSANGVKYTLSSVKTDEDGNVHVFYERFLPSMMTELGCLLHRITVIPGNPHNDSTLTGHYDDTHENIRLSSKSLTVNTTDVEVKDYDNYGGQTGVITSWEQYRSEITDSGIKPAGAERRLHISKGFFDDYALVYHTVTEGSDGPKNALNSVVLNYTGKLTLNVSRLQYSEYANAVMKNWFLAAAVPKYMLNGADTENPVTEDQGYFENYRYENNTLTSDSKTEFKYDDQKSFHGFFDSMEEFDRWNEYSSGQYSHLKDEFITENLFDKNVLYVKDIPAEKTNIKYNLGSLDINGDGTLSVNIIKFINEKEPAADDDTVWHLAAVIPREDLVFDSDDVIPQITVKTQTAIYGKY